jgi:general secretion pathway protein A
MYRAFYGLREKPFNLTPDPRFLYLSDKHKEAFAHLLYGIRSRSGFVMVTGEIGTGKTTICRNLLNQLDEDTELAFIFNPMLSPLELLKKIASEFGVDSTGANALELTEELNQYLLEAAAKGKNCVLLIDEAQNLDPQVLEQIRLLSNLETETEKLLQIVLIGQPELGEKLELHELRQLNQRITARYHLRPLSEKEVLQYIAYRLHVAGGRRKVKFARGAVRAVYKISGGTPRVINALCDRALLIGFTKEIHTITASIVNRAYREIRGDDVFGMVRARTSVAKVLFNPITAVATALILIVVFANSPVLRQRLQGYLDSAAARIPEAPSPPPAKTPAPIAERTAETEVPTEQPTSASETLAAKPADEAPLVQAKPEAEIAVPLMPPALFESSPEDAARAAIGTLLTKWDKEASGEIPGSLDADALSEYALQNGLAIEFLNPAIAQLLALDLPAVIEVRSDDAVRAATLTGVEGDTLHLSAGEDTWTMERSAFREHYTGDAIVLWNDPAPESPTLLPGSRSTGVRKLRKTLALLGRIPGGGNLDTYDGSVSKAVARLQAETSLDVDGIAGKQVRMVLRSWTKPAGTPSLDQTKESTAIAESPKPKPGTSGKAGKPTANTNPAARDTAPPVLAATTPPKSAKAPKPSPPPAPKVSPVTLSNVGNYDSAGTDRIATVVDPSKGADNAPADDNASPAPELEAPGGSQITVVELPDPGTSTTSPDTQGPAKADSAG